MPTLRPPPPPAPDPTDPDSFEPRMFPYLQWLSADQAASNQQAQDVSTLADQAAASAAAAANRLTAARAAVDDAEEEVDRAQAQARAAAASATAAAASAATAVNAPGTASTSASAIAVTGAGPRALTVETAKAWRPGQCVTIASTAALAQVYLVAMILTYDSATGAMTVQPLKTRGSGTYASWSVVLCAPPVVSAIPVYADIPALAAAGGMVDGEPALVAGYGLYLYSAADTGLADGETLVAPASGTGRWQLAAPAWDLVWSYLHDLLADSNAAIAALQPITVRRAVMSFAVTAGGSSSLDLDVPGAQPGMQVVVTPGPTWPTQVLCRAVVFAAGRVRLYASATGYGASYTFTSPVDLTLTRQFP